MQDQYKIDLFCKNYKIKMFAPEPDVKFSNNFINYLMTFLCTSSYCILCLIFYSYNNMINCTLSGIKIQDWILVCGIVYCFIPIIHLSIFGIKIRAFAFIYFFYSFILYLPFNIAWSIVGSIMLFKNSYSCLDNAQNMWILSLTLLIFQWITIFSILWEFYNKTIKCYK